MTGQFQLSVEMSSFHGVSVLRGKFDKTHLGSYTEHMIVSNTILIDADELTKRQWQRLFSDLRYADDEGNEYEPWKLYGHGVVEIPRGAWTLLPDSVTYTDRRTFPEAPTHVPTIELDAKLPDGREFTGQRDAVRTILEQEQGLVIAQPAFGKTNVILATLAVLGTRSLVLVHTHDILKQWEDRVKDVLPTAKLGVMQGSRHEIGDITLATVQTFLRRLREDPTLAMEFGAVVLDEAHHAAASSFEQILNSMHARYRIGVTATERRADGKHPYMQRVIGPVIYRQKFESKVPVECVPVYTSFQYFMRHANDYRGLLDRLIVDEARNKMIANRIRTRQGEGHSTLVLSREIQHLNHVSAELDSLGIEHELLTGERPKAVRDEILKRFRAGQIKCVLATQLADEALDVPVLSNVVLTFPGKHDGRIVQQVGRALREHPDKEKAVIDDFVDWFTPVLRGQWLKRRPAYKKMRIPIKKRPQAKAKMKFLRRRRG